jgi:hypothetical protein
MTPSFETAYEQAQELTVFWCPLMHRGADPPPPRSAKVWDVTDLMSAASQLLEEDNQPPGLAEQIATVYEGLLPALPSNNFIRSKDPYTRTDSDEGDAADGFFAAQIESLKENPSTLEFCLDPTATSTVSFGLWKAREDVQSSSRKSVWVPEINISRTYKQKPELRQFELHLQTYGRKMGQSEILVKLDGHSWFYKTTTRFRPAPHEVRWVLTTTTRDNWTFQFRTILERLNKSHRTRYGQIIVDQMDKLLEPSVGAIIERSVEDEALRLSVMGCSSYLFRPFFEVVLNAAVENSFAEFSKGDYRNPIYRRKLVPSDAILLETRSESRESDREVLYAFYSLGQPDASSQAAGFCLCGLSYPRHEDPVDSSNIANLRIGAAQWIQTQYQLDRNERGLGWSWRLLSSPHFYFAHQPMLLADSNSNETEKKNCEDEALTTAKDRWETLMTEFFEGLNQKDSPLT